MDTPIKKKNTTSQQGTDAFCGRGFFKNARYYYISN